MTDAEMVAAVEEAFADVEQSLEFVFCPAHGMTAVETLIFPEETR